MVRHYVDLFEDDPGWQRRAAAVAARTHEFGTFLVDVLGVSDVGASYRGRIAWHDACHGLRELGIREGPRTLMRHVRHAKLIELPDADSCCGFGGTFSVKHPEISVAMADAKLDTIERAGLRAVVSGRRGGGLRTTVRYGLRSIGRTKIAFSSVAPGFTSIACSCRA